MIKTKYATVPYVLHKKAGTNSVKEIVFEVETIENPNVTALQEIDCELAVILDVSGSMRGEPLDNCIKAVCEIVDNLPSSAIFHLIKYHTFATKVFSGVMNSDNKATAKALIEELQAQDMTNIVDGIVSALECICSPKNEKQTLNRRIFIFTDGEVNQGVHKTEDIFSVVRYIQTNFQINFTSFGLGAQFDQKLMKGIALEGKGDYFFIDGALDISNKVLKGLSVFSTLYAINSRLHIHSVSSEYLSVSVAEVSGYHVASGSEVVSIPIGDICYDDLRQVLLFINVTTKREFSMEPVPIVRYGLDYDVVHADGSVSKRIIEGEIAIEMTEEEDKMEKPDPLKVAVEIYNANQVDKQILPLIAAGYYEEATAMKQKSLAALRSVLAIDKTEVVPHLIKIAESTISSLTSKKDKSSIQKDVGYSRHLGGIVHRKCF